MKRLLLILSLIFSFAGIQAQYNINDKDVVSIRFVANDVNYYLEASNNGIQTVQAVPTDDCLWEIGIDGNNYTFKDLTTGKYLKSDFTDPSQSKLVLADQPTTFSFNNQNSVANQMHGHLYYSKYYEPWWTTISMYIDCEWGGSGPYFTSHSWANYTLYIEKWEKKGAGAPTGHFSPSKIEFTYAADGDAAAAQAKDVTFMIEATTEAYYQCVPRQDEVLLRRSTDNVDESKILITSVYWESTGDTKGKSSYLDVSKYVAYQDQNRTLITISEPTGGQDGKWQFTITPNDKSPMGLKDKLGTQTRWIDYADNVIVEYTYGGDTTQKAEMRVVRKAYHEEELPTISFSINPVTYTFSHLEESKVFEVLVTHQHGTAIYNVDNQIIDTTFTVRPEQIDLTSTNLKLEDDANWFEANIYNNSTSQIIVTAQANASKSKRSGTLTGTITPQQNGEHQPVSFTIPLHQRAEEIVGGIQFIANPGQSGDPLKDGRQQVHTVEKTIYYTPGQAEIELRLQESGYSGYMRWYDYETGGDPYYNYTHEGKQSTSWVRSPRGNNNVPFSAINTPRQGTTEEEMRTIVEQEGHSRGLYTLNKADGGALDESNPYNNNPIIKGWEDGQYHIMACDVSAYTDYDIKTTNGQITSITEPTLSYRQIFHLRPAQEMADKFATLGENEYLEEYHYQAPAGKQVLLSTQYRYKKTRSHPSEMCYFYWANGEGNNTWIDRIAEYTPVVWKEYIKNADGTLTENPNFSATYSAEMDYLIVRSDEYPATKVYTLELPGGNESWVDERYRNGLRIARFEVEFVDIERQGPTNKTIITQQRINSQYKNLAEINFNNTTGHLPWEQASYGYVYTDGALATQFKRGADQGMFPFYGEYIVTDAVNKDWARASAHGGSGKALYVDGTMEPGLVASISTSAKICSGQTMYCSAWFCNPAPSGWSGEGNPIFRCNIQGKNKDEQEWHDAGVYFVGELLKGSGWQQIVFPIQSASTYDETRVSIYNFATTNQGNDFMVDDICLFASQLPIAAYKGEMACRSVENGVTTAVAVLRLDYSNITAGSDGYMFYQIHNESYDEDGDGKPDGADVNLTDDAAYYHDYDVDHGDNNHEHPYGSIHIPEKNFDPEVHNNDQKNANNQVLIYTSVSAFIDDLVLKGEKHGKAYIRTMQSGVTKWLLYVVHLVQSTTQEEINKEEDEEKRKRIPLQQLFDQHKYVMRMAYTPEELPTAECNLTTPLYATQETVFRLRNSDKNTILHTQSGEANSDGTEKYTHAKSTNNCPNDLYFLTSTVVNHLAVSGAGNTPENIAAPIFSDWLIGDPKGDVLSEKAPEKGEMSDEEYKEALKNYNDRLQAAVTGFKDMYGYTHDEVTSAIMYDMRRHTTDDPNSRDYNPNYYAKTFEELQSRRFLSQENYEIVKHLYENGWLQLCDTTVHFYLGTRLDKDNNTIGDTVRYWCFPIAETAKTKVDTDKDGTPESEITLKDCNEPHRVTVSIAGGNHYLNIAPITYENKTPQQNVQIPTLKVLEGSETITIPITELSDQIKTDGANLGTKTITLSLNDLTYFNLETGERYQEKPDLKAGNEYTIRLTMKENDWEYPANDPTNCRVGYAFATIQIVPKTLVWQPTGNSFNGWGKDENWKGWVDSNKNNQIDEGELVEGFVPMAGCNVIIPKLANSLLYPYIVPEDEHSHYPMTIGFEPHRCENIYFAPGAHIHNQHLLSYNRAFVDMQLSAAKWNMVAAPLQDMVAGDMFIPHNGWWSSDKDNRIPELNPFEVKGFTGNDYAGIRHADAAYAFWEAFYTQTVDGSNTLVRQFDNAEFTQSNSLIQQLTPGTGYMVYGLGYDKDLEKELTVRLPKPDTRYYYYNEGKQDNTKYVEIQGGNRGKLAFTATNETPMSITLNKQTNSSYFLFGNPTMAYIDMHALYLSHQDQWNGNFKTMKNGQFSAASQATLATSDRYLPPMTSALLEGNSNDTEMTILLMPSHLTLNNTVNPVDEVKEEDKAMPMRRVTAITDERPINHLAEESELLTIYAFAKDNVARSVLATNPAANDYYTNGEDAIFVSTGIENKSYVTTPLNMYTVAEQVPMMADVRQGISQIPLAILAADNARQEYMQLAFYYTSNWSRTCYFVDHKNGQRTRIMDGLVISVEMPENHEQRYSIEGPDDYQGSDGVTTSTTQPTLSTTGNKVWAYAPDRSTVVVSSSDLIKSATLYDLTGRLIASSSLNSQHSTLNSHLMTNTLTLHTTGTAGVYIVDVTLRDGSTEQAQVIVQ